MSRLGRRAIAAIGSGGFAVALVMCCATSSTAAPASGPITKAQDVHGVWLGEMTGYQAGQEVDWQYRVTFRKSNGQAGVGWQEWRDCTDNKAACAAGKARGGGWSQPARLLFVMDQDHVLHGVDDQGFATFQSDATGNQLLAMHICQGRVTGQDWAASATSDVSPGGNPMTANFAMEPGQGWTGHAVQGSMWRQ